MVLLSFLVLTACQVKLDYYNEMQAAYIPDEIRALHVRWWNEGDEWMRVVPREIPSREQSMEHYLAERVRTTSELLGVYVSSDDFYIDYAKLDDAFSWLDFITAEQFEIVLHYLSLDPLRFIDRDILNYAATILTRDELLYYDSIPIDEMPDDPRRIIVRMYEAFVVVFKDISYRNFRANPTLSPQFLEHGFPRNSGTFDRVLVDWR
jgi:hypothetical protein